jgi:hypothetical protein
VKEATNLVIHVAASGTIHSERLRFGGVPANWSPLREIDHDECDIIIDQRQQDGVGVSRNSDRKGFAERIENRVGRHDPSGREDQSAGVNDASGNRLTVDGLETVTVCEGIPQSDARKLHRNIGPLVVNVIAQQPGPPAEKLKLEKLEW